MQQHEIISWLLKGDIAIQYQVSRDLLNIDRKDIRLRIAHEGWAKKFLSLQNKNGHWGRGFYQPKWISTHYTLLDLKNLQIEPQTETIRKSILMLLAEEKGPDGGVNPSVTLKNSDVCVSGMFLNYAAYFKMPEEMLKSIEQVYFNVKLPSIFDMSAVIHWSFKFKLHERRCYESISYFLFFL